VLTNASENEIFTPIALWLDALDLVLTRLAHQNCVFENIAAVSGAAMQHGTVFWSAHAEALMLCLDPHRPLSHQMSAAFTSETSPNWQDASTQDQCDAFDALLGGPVKLAETTGSSAHHRFSGPQIMRFRQRNPAKYLATHRISLVSSFLASILLGKIAPIDRADVGGMNLHHMATGQWDTRLLSLAAGGDAHAESLRCKLGLVAPDSRASLGSISPYFVRRYGFSSAAAIIPFTGDNPATILSLPLKPNEAIVSLGTSTTFLMSTPHYTPSPDVHFMRHPTTEGLYMFMLCYKNGALAREDVRDALGDQRWDRFNHAALATKPLGQSTPADHAKLALFFPRPEIVPAVPAGTWRALYDPATGSFKNDVREKPDCWTTPGDDVRAILESQFLSLRLRSSARVSAPAGSLLPPQPSRIYLVGGGSANGAMARVCGDVLGGAEGVFRLDIGGNACALGAAYKAAWGCERSQGEGFEAFVASRWQEDGFVSKVDQGYRKGVWEGYKVGVEGLAALENEVIGLAVAAN
jgi:xylulokinase